LEAANSIADMAAEKHVFKPDMFSTVLPG